MNTWEGTASPQPPVTACCDLRACQLGRPDLHLSSLNGTQISSENSDRTGAGKVPQWKTLRVGPVVCAGWAGFSNRTVNRSEANPEEVKSLCCHHIYYGLYGLEVGFPKGLYYHKDTQSAGRLHFDQDQKNRPGGGWFPPAPRPALVVFSDLAVCVRYYIRSFELDNKNNVEITENFNCTWKSCALKRHWSGQTQNFQNCSDYISTGFQSTVNLRSSNSLTSTSFCLCNQVFGSPGFVCYDA